MPHYNLAAKKWMALFPTGRRVMQPVSGLDQESWS